VLSLLAANTSRIITPWLPSRIEPHEPKPLTPASTPPITRPPGAAELSGMLTSRVLRHMLLTRDTKNLRLVVVLLLTLALVLQRLDLTRLPLDFNRLRLDFDRFSGQVGVIFSLCPPPVAGLGSFEGRIPKGHHQTQLFV
jgi:hypothetical protein